MKIINEEVATQLKEILSDINKPVHILFFKQDNCDSCGETNTFLEELTTLNDALTIEVVDIDKDKETTAKYGVERVPAITILAEDKEPNGVLFYGPPMGYEIHSLISSLKEVGGKHDAYSDMVMDKITAIDKDIHIQVFVTPTCPHCPGAVITGHKLAMGNKRIKSDMVEASMFPELANKYKVRGVPKIIINETHELVGNQPVTKFLELIESI